MVLFAGGVWNKKNSVGKNFVTALINNVAPAIFKEKQIIETGFSRLIVGRRQTSSSYTKLIGLDPFEDKSTGFFIGQLFDKTSAGSQPVKFLDSFVIQQIINTQGEFLSKNYWGQYLLLIQDRINKRVFIFPNPQGFSSLFYTEIDEGVIFSSDLWCIKDILGNRADLDDNYLSTQIVCPLNTLTTSVCTPFMGIKEVIPGFGLIVTETGAEMVQFWNPLNIVDHSGFSKDKILSVFFDVINAYLENSPDICLRLSGGLDSSSLLMAAQHINKIRTNKSHQAIVALTLGNSKIASSNERLEAERVANFCNTKLLTYPWQNPYCLDVNNNKYERLDKPYISLLSNNVEKDLIEIASRHNCSVFWSGHGGDQMFCEGGQKNALADYWIDHKTKGLVQNLLNLCKVNRKSIPFFLRNTISSLWRYYLSLDVEIEYLQLKKPNWFLEHCDQKIYDTIIRPPFLDQYKNVKPGKIKHILSIYEGHFQSKVSDKFSSLPIIYPYYAQPLVELALSMPVYESYDTNYSRAPFREVISKFFDTDIVFRKSKGETSGVSQLGLKQNIKRVYELCLEGYFARKGLVNRKLLEQDILRIQHGIIESLGPVETLVATELWLQSWSL